MTSYKKEKNLITFPLREGNLDQSEMPIHKVLGKRCDEHDLWVKKYTATKGDIDE
ncbi:hypothetical protein N9J91_00560 [Gammaproteobacteria bacterium]|nr:hypothetical protein [Gammaproteobacteria bacterium]